MSVSVAEMRERERRVMAGGVSERDLMREAGVALGRRIGRWFGGFHRAVAYLGKGHNAGDALIALRVLGEEFGWEVSARAAWPVEQWAALTREVLAAVGEGILEDEPPVAAGGAPLVLLDGLLGIGGRGGLAQAGLAGLADEMARLRRLAAARVVAVDVPSGVDADCGEIFPGAVHADYTFTLGAAKKGLLKPAAAAAVGGLVLVEVPGLGGGGCSEDTVMICPQEMDLGKERRPFSWHKGDAGRVAVHAGSGAYSGAAVLAALGALRGGAGWVTLYVPEEGHARAAALSPPEIIVRAVPEATAALDEACDARVLGCGWGELAARQQARLIDSLRGSAVPTVIDADALYALSRHPLEGILRENHLLTPHPGEFRRLAADLAGLPAEEAARECARRHPATLLLKGARTCIARQGEPLRCNPTGGPGMACGGQGDLLAGLLAALLACPRGRSLPESAALGAWLAGRAAEIAMVRDAQSEESLSPSDSARWLGQAWEDWRSARR